ncbi:MAG: hypothetical protein AABN95_03470 [Acidobacteriota bacterium]
MSILSNWVSEIGQTAGALGSEPNLGVVQPPAPALSRTIALAGFPGVLPLWSDGTDTVGLMADPRSTPQMWPGVIIKDGQGLTLASDARTLLPQLIVLRVMSNSPDSTREFGERWSAVRDKAIALHKALGGVEETLDTVAAVASDPKAREDFKYRRGEEAKFEAAHSALCRKVDPSIPFLHYADWLDACIAGRGSTPDEPARYAPWGRRVLCWANRVASSQPAMGKLPAAMVHRIIEGHAGVDSGVPVKASWSISPGAASGETALVEAAMTIEHEPPPADPVTAALVRALITEGTTYRGYAHAEAVVILDERGESERAWEVMQSAAWWAARSVGETPEAMLKGAQFMANRHNWADVKWVVERAMTNA